MYYCRVPSQRPSSFECSHSDAVRAASVPNGQALRLEKSLKASVGEGVTNTRVELGVAPQSFRAMVARERVVTELVQMTTARADAGHGHLQAQAQTNDDWQLRIR